MILHKDSIEAQSLFPYTISGLAGLPGKPTSESISLLLGLTLGETFQGKTTNSVGVIITIK